MPSDLKMRLAHVRWIGGPPDAGKSTIAAIVAGALGAVGYHQDAHERRHIATADPVRYPLHAAFRDRLARLSAPEFLEHLWLRNDPETMARDARANWIERTGLIVTDLLAMPADRLIVAEGPGFFPESILPLLAHPSQAIWLLPTDAFKRASHARRNKGGWATQTCDPERARTNHIERDLILARIYREELVAHQLPTIEIDGATPPEETAAWIARLFALPGTPVTA